MIKKVSLFLLWSLFLFCQLHAQNNNGKSDDIGRIALATYVPQQIEQMPPTGRTMLANKLSQIATQSGMGASPFNQRFIITANVTVLTKDITPTAPPMTALTLEITLFIGDGIEGTKFASTSVTIKGVGENETKAYISALKNINQSNTNFQSFIDNGKNKIVEYYNSKCDFILKDAEGLAGQYKYDEAIFKLMGVPNVCKDCYNKCMNKTNEVFKAKMEHECQKSIADAQALKVQDKYNEAASILANILPDVSCYGEAQNLLREINDHKCSVALGKAQGAWGSKDVEGTSNALKDVPADSKCYQEAVALANEVRAWVKEKDKREWDFKLEEKKSDVEIQKARIDSEKAIGVAYGNHQPTTVYKVVGWW